jgi:hypothetical protein
MTSSRANLASLRRLVRDSSERTFVVQERVEVKRNARKKKETEIPRSEVPNFELEYGQTKVALVNSVQVEDWFREGLNLLYGGKLELPQRGQWWTATDRSKALRLLKMYDADLVKKAVFHLCATWNQRVDASDGRLAGIPGIGLLVSARTRNDVFAEVQGLADVPKAKKASKRKKSKDSDEYRPPETPNDVGWYL